MMVGNRFSLQEACVYVYVAFPSIPRFMSVS